MMTRLKPTFVSALASRLGERMLNLPPALTRDVTVERDIPITVDAGVTLLADHWAPTASNDVPGGQRPVVLVRTAYGPGGPLGWMYGRALAERGMHVLMVRSRGTFGSDGDFLAMRHEREDGLATLRWLAEQSWGKGGVVLAGSSYFGYTQWAIAAEAPLQVKAMVPHITSSRLALTLLRPGRFELDTLTNWVWNTETQERPRALLRSMLGLDRKRIAAAMNTLPPIEVDKALLGYESPFFQETLRHDQNDPYWMQQDHSSTVGEVTVPVSSITGWYDIFLADQLRDFQALADAGRNPRLTVGPWWHADPRGMSAAIEQVVDWGATVARGEPAPDRAPVRLFVMGIEQWRDFDQWPPAGYRQQPWYLRSGGKLDRDMSGAGLPSTFSYDPNDPTPSLGGPKLDADGPGPKDNRPLERRADVLTFTSPVLTADLEVIGDVSAQVWLRADRPSNDLFVRLCDVDERGRSINICDELVTVRADGITEVTVKLSPTAHMFKRGHRLRVQISAGAFPRFARNLGGGEPIATATKAHVTHIEILHDHAHPSAVLLPAR